MNAKDANEFSDYFKRSRLNKIKYYFPLCDSARESFKAATRSDLHEPL